MKISIYPKDLIEQVWKEDEKRLASDAGASLTCLRCGKPLNQHMAVNALSRRADVYICQECGANEALWDALGEPDPLRDWYAVTSGRIGLASLAGPVLVPVCSFERIFDGPKKLFPLSSVEHPVSEVAYSRSGYDGHQWWRTWFPSGEEHPESALIKEIDQFSNTLMELPELKSLNAMGRMCRSCAQTSSDSTEFNLYSETKHFYIWIRLITREQDYNLYVHFYLKSQAD